MAEPRTWLVRREQEGNVGAVAQHIKEVVKLKAKREIEAGVSGIQDAPWFVERHLGVVEDRMNWILDNCEEAKEIDRDEALITVWTHDLGRTMGWDYSHHQVSAQRTRQWLLDNGLSEEMAERIFGADLKHRASGKYQPETPLAKAIASADALSHFDGCETGTVEGFLEKKGFWYLLWREEVRKGMPDEQILAQSYRKMERDATSKQGFEKSRERAEKEYKFLKDNATEILKRIRNSVS